MPLITDMYTAKAKQQSRRITVIESVNYQDPSGMSPTVGTVSRFTVHIPTGESQPYIKRDLVGGDWESLVPENLVSCSLLVLENYLTKFQRVPTKEQQAEV